MENKNGEIDSIIKLIKKTWIDKYDFNIITRMLTLVLTRGDDDEGVEISFHGVYHLLVSFDSEEVDECLYLPDIELGKVNEAYRDKVLPYNPCLENPSLLCLRMEGSVTIKIIFETYQIIRQW
jgi:hypothetical protein